MKQPVPGIFFLFVLINLIGNSLYAQSILSRKVSLNAVDQPLGKVMALLEQTGTFRFSYNTKTVHQDSLVSLQAQNITVKETLDLLFKGNFEYKETENFIILRYAPLSLSLVIEKATGDQNFYTIGGYVTEEISGRKIYQASVYEKSLARGTLTNENGYFEIELHDIYQPVVLTASKEYYKDATSFFLREVNVTHKRKREYSDYSIRDFNGIAGNGMARFLTSTKQQIQSLNLPGVFSSAPYQVALTPAINTHGDFSGQVINHVSLNLFGGYNAGVNGVELGGLFNINKMDVNGVQAAGLFNVAGGSVTGVQLSGLYNDISGDASGVRLAGLFNHVHGNTTGVQIAGIYNRADTADGFQFALINIANSSAGYSFGLVNFIGNGFNKISIGYNETVDLNISLKTGTNMLYTIWRAGMNVKEDNKLYTFGLGIGKGLTVTKWLTVNPELSCNYLYQGDWKATNLLNRLDLGFNFRLNNVLSITTGPSVNIYYSDQGTGFENYAYVHDRTDSFNLRNNKLRGWIGWAAAITVF
jgi:hypothetical protein